MINRISVICNMHRFRLLLLFCVFTNQHFLFAQTITDTIANAEMQYKAIPKFNKKSLLTESYNVVYHRLDLDINPARKWVYGAVTTYFKPTKPAFNLIQFDCESYLQIDSVIFHKGKVPFNQSGPQLTIQLSNAVNVGEMDSVTVFYQGNPGLNNPHSSFVFDAHNPNGPVPIVWTLSEPYGAKGWWPCKESLYDKIDSVDILLRVKKGNMGASNGVLVQRSVLNDSQELFHWKHRYPIATYLVGIAVTNYVAYSDYAKYPGNDSLEILNYVYPEAEADARSKSWVTPKMIRLYDSLFGIYPFKNEKYGHAQWGWGGGMEHQTMSFMVSFNFDLIAHELAHQWFGDQATCGSWSELWLNEGFATYLNALCHEFLISKSDFRGRMNDIRTEVLKDNTGSVFVSDTANRSRLFSGRLTYNKGAFVLHMLRWKMGDDAFFAGIRNYLLRPEVNYGFGTTNALKAELEKASGQQLTEFFKDWYYGEGFPIYDITWSHVGTYFNIRIKQSSSTPGVSFFNLPLPVKVYGKTRDTLVVFDPLTKDNSFLANLGFIPQRVEFDPDVKVLGKYTVLKVRPENSPSIQVFPVPTSNILNIYNYTGNIESVQIFDLSGKRILDWDFKALNQLRESQELDVMALSAGVYVIKITTESGTAIQKLVKS